MMLRLVVKARGLAFIAWRIIASSRRARVALAARTDDTAT